MPIVVQHFTAGETPPTGKWEQLNLNDQFLNSLLTGVGGLTSQVLTNPFKFSAYLNTTQNVASGVTKILLDTKSYDTGSNFDATTNHRFIAPAAGFYQFTGSAQINGDLQGAVALYKNGSQIRVGSATTTAANASRTSNVSDLVPLSAGDYIELYWTSATGAWTLTNSALITYLTGYFVSAS
jgi:hypothetical protein